jgi:hypothetical protein
VLALHQAHLHTLPHDLFQQLLEQFRLLEILGGVSRRTLPRSQRPVVGGGD